MSADLVLIKLFMKSKDLYQTYQPHIRMDALEREAQTILSDMGLFYETFENKKSIGEEFKTWFHQVAHPELAMSQRELYNHLFDRIEGQSIEEQNDFIKVVLRALDKEVLREQLQEALEDPNWEPSKIGELTQTFTENDDKLGSDSGLDWDINAIMDTLSRESGVKWPLNCLQRSIGPLIKGDFGVVAAPVDCGKTAFMVQMAVYMAHQLTDGKVLFFNNEQQPRRVQKRLINAALAIRSKDINMNRDKAIADYTAYMNGDVSRIEIFHGLHITPTEILRKAKKHNAKLIIIDMLDKLQLPGKVIESENIRTQKLYAKLRDISQQICPIIGSSQCDGTTQWKDFKTKEPRYQHYITMHQLQESRVKKQGELEFLITIGWDPEMPNIRFFHVAKNKLPGDGTEKSRYIKSEVAFDGSLSMFKD